jgi:hypothetical protein
MLAESEYRDMLNDNTWTGIHTKGTKSVFQAGGKNSKGHQGTGEGPKCWNGCGGRHVVQDCKPSCTPSAARRLSRAKKTTILDPIDSCNENIQTRPSVTNPNYRP